jgi:peptidoglycan/LPS O-acetylase OafA/YrhL
MDWTTLVCQLACIQNLTQTYGSFAASWSITNELAYYLFYGVLVSITVRRRGRACWVGIVCCVLIAALMQYAYMAKIWTRTALSVGLLFGLGVNWFLGVLVAIDRETLVRSPLVEPASRSWPLVLGVAMALRMDGRFPLQGIYLLCGVAFTLMLVRFLCQSTTSRQAPEPRWLASSAKVLGLASYPTYLFHGPVIMLTGAVLIRWHLDWDWRLTWLVLIGAGTATGIAFGHFAEAPIMAWRARWLERVREAGELEPKRTQAGLPPVATT